jgi:hypothetical protein
MREDAYRKIAALLDGAKRDPTVPSANRSVERPDASTDTPDHLPMSHGQHDAFLKARRDRIKFSMENRRAIVSDKHLNEATAFVRQLTQIDVTLGQVETMLDLYPFVRIQVAKYGVYTDKMCMDELANMIGDFFLGSAWPRTNGKGIGEDEEFLSLLRQQAEKMGYRLIKEPSAKPR